MAFMGFGPKIGQMDQWGWVALSKNPTVAASSLISHFFCPQFLANIVSHLQIPNLSARK
jgi:hypothetical protein